MRDEKNILSRRRTRPLRWAAFAVALALMGGFFWMWKSSREESRLGPELRVVRPEKADLEQSLSVRARIEAARQQDVLAAGVPVAHVQVEESQRVRRGDLLLRYDLSGLEAAYEEARQLRHDSEAQLEAMQAEQTELAALAGLGEIGDVDFSALSGANSAELDRLNASLAALQATMSGFSSLGSTMSGFEFPDLSGLESLAGLEGLVNALSELQGGMGDIENGAVLQRLGDLSQQLRELLLSFQTTLTQLQDFVVWLRTNHDEIMGECEDLREDCETRASELEEQLREIIAQLPSDQPCPSTSAQPDLTEGLSAPPGDTPAETGQPEVTLPDSEQTTATTVSEAGGAAMFAGLGSRPGSTARFEEAALASYLQELEGQLGQANSLLTSTRLSEEQALQLLEETPREVRADFDGIVSGLSVAAGDEVAAGRLLLTLYAEDSLYAHFDANRSDLARIAVGQKVSYSYGVLDFTGEIKTIARVSTQTGQTASSLLQGSGVEATVPVAMSIEAGPGAREALVIGFDIDASILLAAREEVPAIPHDAVLYRDGKPWVWTVNGEGRLEARTIRLGLVADFAAEIVDGLDSEDRVVLHPPGGLKAGDPVRAVEAGGD